MQLEQKKEINEFQEKHTLILLSGVCWPVLTLEQQELTGIRNQISKSEKKFRARVIACLIDTLVSLCDI